MNIYVELTLIAFAIIICTTIFIEMELEIEVPILSALARITMDFYNVIGAVILVIGGAIIYLGSTGFVLLAFSPFLIIQWIMRLFK